MTTKAAFNFLLSEERERVVYGVLKKLHVGPLHPQYQDFLQEGRIIFAEAYLAYKKLHPASDNEHDLMLFAYQRIRWRLLDILRKEQHHISNCQSMESLLPSTNGTTSEIVFEAVDPTTFDTEEETLNCELYERLLKQCTKNEAKYLQQSFLFMRPIAEIARMYGVSRQTIYNWRAGIQQKAKSILDEETPAA